MIRGTVTDSTLRPIEDVEVYALGTGRRTRTDSAGRFALVSLVAGSGRVVFRRPGWRQVDTVVATAPGSFVELRIAMARVAQVVEAAYIISQDECPNRTLEGFECRRRAGIGVFRDAAEIAALKPLYLADLLFGVEGLRRDATRSGPQVRSTEGWRCVRSLVDGRPGRSVVVSDVVAVEFYSHYDKVPEWYKNYAFMPGTAPTRQTGVLGPPGGRGGAARRPATPGHSCALVVYWTRFAPAFDPAMDQSPSVGRMLKAQRDSLRPRLDSGKAKKPRS